jgi:hypothetical protein
MPIITRELLKLSDDFKAIRRAQHIGMARAVQRAGTTIKAEQSREIAQRLNLRAATIKNELTVKRQPKPGTPEIVFAVKARGVPLHEFGARQGKRGVSVKVFKQGSRALLTAAWQAKRFGGKILGRVSASNRKQYGSPHVGRLPLKPLFGPNVLSQYITDTVQRRGADTWARRIPIELERELAFALKKAGFR